MADKVNLQKSNEKKKRKLRSRGQRLLDRAKIVQLIRRGYTQKMIAEELGLSAGTVCNDWNKVVERMNANRDVDMKYQRTVLVEQLMEVQREAWAALERSKEDFVKVVEEESSGGGPLAGTRTRTIRTTEGRLPAPEYMNIINKCIHQISELSGAYPSKDINLNTNVMNWDIFALEEEIVEDPIEAEILSVTPLEQIGQKESTDVPEKK